MKKTKSVKPPWLPFEEAVIEIHKHQFRNEEEFKKWHKSEKPKDIPSNPARTYKKEWKGLGYWLGTSTKSNADRKREMWPFQNLIRKNTFGRVGKSCY
jgi:hypothetical protein